METKIILASASPRRKELLAQIGLDFEIMVSDKETDIDSDDPKEACKKQAIQKAEDIHIDLHMRTARKHM